MKKCYNEDISKLDYKDKFIGLMGIEDIKLAKSITKGDAGMEEILKKVEDFSDDDEIIGAYDAEWHKQEVDRVVRLAQLEEAQEEGLAIGMKKGMAKGIQQGMKEKSMQIVKNMLKENIDMETISKVTGLSKEEIEGTKNI